MSRSIYEWEREAALAERRSRERREAARPPAGRVARAWAALDRLFADIAEGIGLGLRLVTVPVVVFGLLAGVAFAIWLAG